MADFDPDAYLSQPVKTGFDPDAYLANGPEPADHGLSQRQKLSPVGKALSPITGYWDTYGRMRKEAEGQISEGAHQMTHPDSLIDPKAHGLSDVLGGAVKTAAGAAGFVWSPAAAAYRSIIGQPIEDTTGIPREYPEFAAQLATPGVGLTSLRGGPKPIPSIPRPTIPTDPFGVTLTEGERTGDLATRQAEQAAIRGQAGKPAQEHAQEFLNVNRPEQLEQAHEAVTRQLDPTGQQILAESPEAAAKIAQKAVTTESRRAKDAVTAAYDRAKALGGELHPDVLKDMQTGIREDLNNATSPVVVDDGTPVAARMLKYLDDRISKLNVRNEADLSKPIPSTITGVNLEGVDQLRKGLSTLRGDALKNFANPSDIRATDAIMRSFDEHIHQAVNDPSKFNGTQRAVDAWNDARSLASERFKTYGNDAVGKKIQQIVGNARFEKDPASLQAVADFMYGSSGVSPTDLQLGVAKRLQKILGADSAEWAAIRQGYFQRLTSTAEGVPDFGSGTLATRLSKALDERLADVMFTPPQRDILRSYANLHRQLSVPQVAANWPNTAAGVIPHIRAVTDKVLGAVGAYIGHHILPVAGGFAGWAAGEKASSILNAAENSRNLRQIAQQMPLLSQKMKVWQEAVKAQQRANTVANQSRKALAATNVTAALGKLGINDASTMRLLRVEGPGTSQADENVPGRAEGGAVGDDYNTFLTPEQEVGFQTWKAQNAPNDSGYDYDLRGAYLANMQPDPRNNHMGDQFKKPNHPTFSDQSQYATGDQADRAGHWIGPEGPDQTFVPPVATRAEGGAIDDSTDDVPEAPPKRLYMNMSQEGEPKLVPELPDTRPAAVKSLAEKPFSGGTKVGNRLTGLGGEERFQTWPERMLRSGTTLAGDVLSGEQPMLPPGLRREDITDKPPPSGFEVTAQPNDPAYERVQDMAGLAGSGGLGAGVEGGAAALGSAPFLRPALKYEGKIYKAPVGGQHLDALPEELHDTFHNQALSGEDISNFNFGFMNHKGQFLDREKAMDYAVKEGLIDPHAANQGALTSTILEDSSLAGAPLAALEHAQPFYSAVEKTIQSAPQSKMHGEQWANWLKNQPGVKPDELQYIGIDNWLREQKGPVSKQQVTDFIDKNKVQVNDVVKGEPTWNSIGKEQQLHLRDLFEETEGREPKPGEMPQWFEQNKSEMSGLGEEATKYSSYQLPGGENYREHLITLPAQNEAKRLSLQHEINSMGVRPETSDRRNALMKEWKALDVQQYKSSHWDEPNVLAHVRTNDRDVGGKPSLHLEELQSDWHQKGRKFGYKGQDLLTPSEKEEFKNLQSIGEAGTFTLEQAKRYRELSTKQKFDQTVPDAPFKTSWPELAMKRIIAKAIEEGKDRISWTPGEAQAARYDLSKHIKNLHYTDDGHLLGIDHNGRAVIQKNVPEKDLPDVIGKEAAEKLLNAPRHGVKKDERSLLDSDLKFGGEGMKGFYDQMLPKMVEKLGKQYGVKVKEGNTPGGADIRTPRQVYDILSEKDPRFKADHPTIKDFVDYWNDLPSNERDNIKNSAQRYTNSPVKYFDIPEKMKQDVLSKGFPLFSDTAHAGLLNQNTDKDKQNIERPVQEGKAEPKINAPVERAAGGRVLLSNMNHSPSEAQKHAGNYAKDHIRIHGLDITIENARGKERSGSGKDGKRWSVKMPAHYGYLKRTEGADGDHVDVYVGPHIKCDKVFVVNQMDADTKEFDEVKVMLCFGSFHQAVQTYKKGFSDGKGLQRIGSIVATDIPHFKTWLRDANTKKPFVVLK